MSTSAENRKLNGGLVFLSGLFFGVVCYLTAEALTPKQVFAPGEHDILLANRLGFIYTPVVGLWLGWLQRSLRRALIGAGVGIAVGFIYRALSASRNFLAIMVGFPSLLGGILSAVVGSNRSPWLSRLPVRLGKGLLAGVVLGFVYMLVLNLGLASGVLMSPAAYSWDETQVYIARMWRDGPFALGIASALFFILIRWAVGLTRVRLIVFEDVDSKLVEPTAPPNGGPVQQTENSSVGGGPPSVS